MATWGPRLPLRWHTSKAALRLAPCAASSTWEGPSMASMGSWWKKPMGKAMEKPWKSHGKTMGKTMEPADVPFLNHLWDFLQNPTQLQWIAMCCSMLRNVCWMIFHDVSHQLIRYVSLVVKQLSEVWGTTLW